MMEYPGARRVKEVYPLWAILYLILFAFMILLEIKLPFLLLLITAAFSLKTILLDYKILKIKRRRVYWLEHGPFLAEIILLGVLAEFGISLLQGYVNFSTILIAIIGFILDFWKDLKEHPKVYK